MSTPRKTAFKPNLKSAQSSVKLRNRTPAAATPAGALATLGSPFAAGGADVSTAIEDLPGLDASGSVSLSRRIAAISRWRDFYDPLVGFNVARARTLSEDYTKGWMADLQWTYFFLEGTDPDLFALADRRTSRLLEMDVVARIEKEADKTLAAEQSAMIDEKMGHIDNLYEAIEHLAMASFRGFAHCEKWYGEDGEINHLEVVDQWNVVRDGLRGGWKYNPRAYQAGYFGLDDSYIIDPKRFIIREVRRHINRIALLKFTSKKLTEVDWDAFGEIYGIPSGVVIGPPSVSPDNKAAFQVAAEEIARGGSGFLPYGSLYEKNDMPRGGSPFKERLEYLTEKLILIGTGGMLTMLARSGSGTLGGNAHADVFEQLAKADAKRISDVIDQGLVNDWLAKEFPGQPKAARFALAANEETKTGDVVAHIKDLYAAGLEVDEQEASERTGYKLKRIAKPTAPAAVAPGAEDGAGVGGAAKPAEPGEPAKIANRAPVNAGQVVFDRNARRALSAVQVEAVQPVLDRVAALKALPPDQFAAALQTLRTDLPRLFAEARLHSPDIAAVWDQVLGTALLDGLAEAPTPTA